MRTMKRYLLLPGFAFMVRSPQATVMGDIASQMKTGEWKDVSTSNLGPTVKSNPGSDHQHDTVRFLLAK